MIPELLGRLVWRTGKLVVRYVVVPMAITALTAQVLGNIASRVEGKERQSRLDGVIRPAI